MKLVARCLPLCLTLACGEPWTPAAGPMGARPADDPAVARTAAWLVAAEGGVVVAPDGRARLVVPPYALVEDGEVSIGWAAPAHDSMSATYVVAPEGLALNAPLSIEIELAAEVPWGRRASAAMYMGDHWEELPETFGASIDGVAHAGDAHGSSDVAGAVAVAPPDRARRVVVGALMHSAKLAAVLWEEIPLASPFCEAAELTDCAGSPLGTWHMDGACAPELAALNDPFENQCPEERSSVELLWRGTFQIGEGAVSAAIEHQETIITVEAPLSCAADDACAARSNEARTCVASASRCRCVERQVDAPQDSAVPMSIEGDELVLSDGFGHEHGRVRYCRQGDRLLLEARSTGPGTEHSPVLRYVLHR